MVGQPYAAARSAAHATGTLLTSRIGYVPQTGYYPRYDAENDQVDPVAPAARARFQRVIPRYRLSGSETNDTGLGPSFYDVPVLVTQPREPQASVAPRQSHDRSPERPSPVPPAGYSPAPLQSWQGQLVDLFV